MIITRVWAMPSRWTFTIKPIKDLLNKHVSGYWCDPFCGENSPATIKNDLNPNNQQAQFHLDAIHFLNTQKNNTFDGVLFDPPYSPRQVKECYEGFGIKVTARETKMSFWSQCKDEMVRVIKPGGLAICCGWTSQGLGKNRDFELLEILLVPHGGSKNDTIVTVERKKS